MNQISIGPKKGNDLASTSAPKSDEFSIAPAVNSHQLAYAIPVIAHKDDYNSGSLEGFIV